MPCDVQSLLDSASGFAGLNGGMADALQLALLCRIGQALDPDMSCDIQTLLDEGKCFTCISAGMLPIIQTALLCRIADGISGAAASGCVPTTNGDPEGVLISACSPALAVDPNTSAIYLFTGVAGTNTGWNLKV